MGKVILSCMLALVMTGCAATTTAVEKKDKEFSTKLEPVVEVSKPPIIVPAASGKRISHTGRVLPELTEPIKEVVLFNTREADAIMASLQMFPVDSPFNEDISGLPVMKNSDQIIAVAGAEKSLQYNLDMCYMIVPPTQPKIEVKISSISQSDPGPYPVPENTLIEGQSTPSEDYQRMGEVYNGPGGGDRHGLILDPYAMKVYEFFRLRKDDSGWVAENEATFDLTTNKTRKNGWTSSDAAGLPVMPLSIRYDEVARGMVEHAVRFTIKYSQNSFVWPASHHASPSSNKNYPRMGERYRLKKDVDISDFEPHVQAILAGLKKYGMIVADNGGDWRMSICPDPRFKDLEDLKQIKGGDFEVIVPTTKSGGPRANK